MLSGKVILVVDDEPDILETVKEILEQCQVETAGSFASAQTLLETRSYDMAVLDIMGVKGVELLQVAVGKQIPSVMLTAPALTPDYILKCMELGATSYLPKEDITQLDRLLEELFAIMASGGSARSHTMKRLELWLDEHIGHSWRDKYGKLWE
ncbi:response regulator [Desulfomonile tiedjei]|uniref:Response regulator with CheY-like receiver, AAA-type ATPase, and DNA-binding domains n=1 Tax=Desulfomonile tiedjei (strain ATCC 49306 / DSM 6799 / DCB-1) TaxID=706587 RepID=I4C4G9_DESTA|nr:response regulator [Desulfomonile tiedjei]AFM24460.1 response regulator with CheY-like receiver, AAA-type ATPase, and DNA-binding domains [Desulfomonile tiedjei DSM 6799]